MDHSREEQVVHLRENGMEGNIDEQLAAIADAVISIEGHLSRIADAIENRPILLTPEEMKPAPKLFISIPENKNREHTFRLCDLRSYRDYYFQYEPQGGFGSPLTAEEITDRIESAFELKPADAIGKE